MAGIRLLLVVLAAFVSSTCCSFVAVMPMPMPHSMPVMMPSMPQPQPQPQQGSGPPAMTVADICRKTSFPDLCTATAGKEAVHYATVDVPTVLLMQVDGLAKSTDAARARVGKESETATPAGRKALEQCNSFYGDVLENLGACRRAIGHKDAVTIRSTMSMVAQDLQFCNEEFRKAGEKNPLDHLDKSLGDLSEICRSLSNMIVAD